MRKLKILFYLLFLVVHSFNTSDVSAAIQNISATISFDGTSPFDADNSAGNDSSSNNSIIRTQDTFEYLIKYEALDTNNTTIVLTAPAGVYWLSTATASSVCNGTGGGFLNGAGNVLTCNRKPPVTGIESFYVRAMPGNIAHGSNFTTTVAAGSATATSEALTVSATPKNDIWWIFNNFTKTTVNGQVGTSYQANFEYGATVNSNGNLKGYESMTPSQTITLNVGPGSVPYNCSICSQAGGPGTPITITNTINPSFTRSGGNIVGSPGYIGIPAFRGLGLNTIQIFAPYDPNYPAGQITPLTAQAKSWDPLSLSGASNFGSSFATGYDPSFTCPSTGTITQIQKACLRYLVDRTILTSLIGLGSGAIDGTTATGIFGDNNEIANGVGAGAESIVVGQKIRALIGIHNEFTAENAVTNAGACVVWDPAKLELFDTPLLKFQALAGPSFRYPTVLNWSNLSSSDAILEFTSRSFSSDTDRKSYDCGKAGDNNSEWSSSPLLVPGGLSAVSGIRYKFLNSLNPKDTLGLVIPLKRPTSTSSQSLTSGTMLPWFQQFYGDQKTLTKSTYSGTGYSTTGGAVVAVNSLFRATQTLSPNSIAPGTTSTVTITPITIGPVGVGIDSTVTAASITIALPANSCIEPVLTSLPSYAVFTPGNYGADGIPCSGDAGETAGNIKFNLGNLTAPGGNAGSTSGHRTSLPPFSFNLIAATNATIQTSNFTTTASASSDPSPNTGFGGLNKVNNFSIAINAVAAFSTVKSVSGITNNKVGPNETFTYTINFGNGGGAGAGVGRFVDILPFDGDRNGTVSLGTGKIEVVGITAGMTLPSQGTVNIQTSTDSPTAIQTAISVAGNESGETGVTWSNYTGGNLPTGITAVRFVTSNALNSGFSGFGSIQVKAPTINTTSKITNSVNARTDALNNDINTVKFLQNGSPVTITGLDGATLSGSVFYDLNENAVKDSTEAGVSGAKVVVTCTAGACLTAPQGTVFSVVVGGTGIYNFTPNAANTVFANNTASGTALANFQGLIAGTWTITEIAPTALPHVNVSTSIGTVDSLPSGSKSGRTISGVVILSNSVVEKYNFGERLAHGKIKVTALPFTLPSGVSGPFNFTYTATCDLPIANSIYTATLNNYPSNTTVDIVNIPAGSSCTVQEGLPNPPAGYVWDIASFSALSPSGSMPAGGTLSTDVSNGLLSDFSIKKTILSGPSVVVGNSSQYEIIYRISIKNHLASAQTYSLNDTLGLDADFEVQGAPAISTSSNVTQPINSSFSGTGSQINIVTNEQISAGSSASPSIETYDIKAIVNRESNTSNNDICSGTPGNGFYNSASLNTSSTTLSSVACTDSPSQQTTGFELQVVWQTERTGATVTIPSMSFSISSSASNVLASMNYGAGTAMTSDLVSIQVNDSGMLPMPTFDADNSPYLKYSQWMCNGEPFSPNSMFYMPTNFVGQKMACSITITSVELSTTKSALPASGTTVSVDDVINYTLTTTLTGDSTAQNVTLTDTLSNGLEFINPIPDGCTLSGQKLTCIIAAGSAPGDYQFAYKAKVLASANKATNPGVSNIVESSLGSCTSCVTFHGMWSADTQKESDADDKKGVRIGDEIRYTVSVTIKNGPNTQAIIIQDTRSVGLQVNKIPNGCSQIGRTMTCIIPEGSANGVYQFKYTATVTKEAKEYVSNTAVPNQGTCKTSCSTRVKVLRDVVLRITKTTFSQRVKIGDFVKYSILIENLSAIDANDFFILDQPAPGLHFVESSITVSGDKSWKVESLYPLKITQLDVEAFKKVTISYLMRVGAGAGRGTLKNIALADDNQNIVSSNISTATVTRVADPDFEDSHIMGVVFEDENGNGIQDENEIGVSGARLTTAQGLIIETDAFGRYHLAGIDNGNLARGRNFVIKLDVNSISTNKKITTQNPLVKRITHGMPTEFNFGIR